MLQLRWGAAAAATLVAQLALAMAFGAEPERLGANWDTWQSKTLRSNYTAQHTALGALRDAGVSRVKIFAWDRGLIAGISDVWGDRELRLMISVANPELAGLAEGFESYAPERMEALMDVVSDFSHRIEFIAVGNEVEYPAINNRLYAPLLLPVLQALHRALTRRGLSHVRLTAPFSDVMIIPQHYPSAANFMDSYDSALSCNFDWCRNHTKVPMMKWVLPALDFLNRTGGAFTTSLYPFYKWRNLGVPAWCRRPGYGPCEAQPLDFAVGAPGAEPLHDKGTGLLYRASLAVMIDSVRFALARIGYSRLQFLVGETGWPSSGTAGTNQAVACHFLNSAAAVVREGTPAEAHFPPIIAYIFQWTDEDGKYELLGKPEKGGAAPAPPAPQAM